MNEEFVETCTKHGSQFLIRCKFSNGIAQKIEKLSMHMFSWCEIF